MNAKQLLKLASKKGWEVKSQNGSHIKIINVDLHKSAIIPYHGSQDIPTGTLESLLKRLGLK